MTILAVNHVTTYAYGAPVRLEKHRMMLRPRDRYTMDARHNHPRIGRIVMGRGRDAADVAISTAFGVAELVRFEVVTEEQTQND